MLFWRPQVHCLSSYWRSGIESCTKPSSDLVLLFSLLKPAHFDDPLDIDYTQIPVSALVLDTDDLDSTELSVAASLEKDLMAVGTRYAPGL